ncbi:MAG: EFR1 family ferrodoxin [Candidatus ainarchaeum sp.]|nr:EFR1 family ferrodoxin [Candidatus ainarchaeum sp.]MDD3976078.1 EFR1 family ferrodoxin [Candidatus ainarchaeum sp.]
MVDLKDLKKGILFSFSGTGNTEFISIEYCNLFKKKEINLDLKRIEEMKTVPSLSKYDFVVFATPVYAFDIPFYVIDFIKKLAVVDKKKCFIVLTHAGNFGRSFQTFKNILGNKNFDLVCGFDYKMPSNSDAIFSDNIKSVTNINEVLDKNKENVLKDFNSIFENNLVYPKTVFLKRNVFSLINYFFTNFFLKKFKWSYDNIKCIQCGLCEKVCPTKNIVLKKQKKELRFSNKCVMCTRCYNFCPTGAIYYKKNKDIKRYNYFKKYFE